MTFELYPLSGSMRDANHTPATVAARIADGRARYCIGMIVQRNDFGPGTGPLIRIDRIEEPTCGGYLYASGTEVDLRGICYSTGPLHKTTPVHWVWHQR